MATWLGVSLGADAAVCRARRARFVVVVRGFLGRLATRRRARAVSAVACEERAKQRTCWRDEAAQHDDDKPPTPALEIEQHDDDMPPTPALEIPAAHRVARGIAVHHAAAKARFTYTILCDSMLTSRFGSDGAEPLSSMPRSYRRAFLSEKRREQSASLFVCCYSEQHARARPQHTAARRRLGLSVARGVYVV